MTKRLNVKFKNNEAFRKIAGSNDRNLKILEAFMCIKIYTKGEFVNVKLNDDSLDIEKIERVFKALIEIAGYDNEIHERDVIYVYKQCKNLESCKNIIDVYIDKTEIANLGKRRIYAKSMNQKLYYNMIQKNDVVFGFGPAGTGKTYIPIIDAAYKLKKNIINKIILTRPAVEAGENLGFLPGDLKDKVDPYLRPLYDGLHEVFTKDEVTKFIEEGRIEIAPLAFMRGRTLDNAYIILDEAQNTTKGQMKLFLTRLGFGSTMVVTGDITQVDLPRNVKSGLKQAIETLRNVDNVGILEFETSDIMRHPIVQNIVENFDKHDTE